MDIKCALRPVFALRVVIAGISVGLLLDVFGRAWVVFHSGQVVTLQNIAAVSSRPFHVGAWLVSGFLFLIILSYVVGRSIEFFWLERKAMRDLND